MKTLIILGLLVSTLAQAETIREATRRKEMLARVSSMKTLIVEARNALKEKEVILACDKIKDVLNQSEEHLLDVGMHLDPMKVKNHKMRQSSLQTVMILHKMEITCDKGKNSEFIDPKGVSKELKAIAKDLKKQGKRIKSKKVSVGFDNDFEYDYKLRF